jgi:hypothetical protein
MIHDRKTQLWHVKICIMYCDKCENTAYVIKYVSCENSVDIQIRLENYVYENTSMITWHVIQYNAFVL